ncbi:MAG: hypothetical protein AAFV85_23640 [Cyanobacteria bacterium J06634_6]
MTTLMPAKLAYAAVGAIARFVIAPPPRRLLLTLAGKVRRWATPPKAASATTSQLFQQTVLFGQVISTILTSFFYTRAGLNSVFP